MTQPPFNRKQFIRIMLLTSIWVHASEVFRYFVLVMPRTRQFFEHRMGIAEMNWGIFTIWGVWDTLLTALMVFLFWLHITFSEIILEPLCFREHYHGSFSLFFFG